MNAEQQRDWGRDVNVTSSFPQFFTQPRRDRDADLVAFDRLSRENQELRAEIERLRDAVERLTQERDRAREDCGFQKGLKESIREELSNFIRLKQDAEAELADATTAAQNLRDELQGAQERLRAVVVQTLRDAAQDAVEPGDIGKPNGVEAWVWLRAWADQLETEPKPPWVVP